MCCGSVTVIMGFAIWNQLEKERKMKRLTNEAKKLTNFENIKCKHSAQQLRLICNRLRIHFLNYFHPFLLVTLFELMHCEVPTYPIRAFAKIHPYRHYVTPFSLYKALAVAIVNWISKLYIRFYNMLQST